MQFISNTRWPSLACYVHQNYIEAIDFVLAQLILKNHPNASEEVAAFFLKLSLASRNGHLCLKMQDGTLVPKCSELIENKAVALKLDQLADLGLIFIPDGIIGGSTDIIYPVISYADSFYFNKNFFFETRFIEQIQRIKNLAQPSEVCIDSLSTKLNQKQKNAVIFALKNNVLLISGGPGTGKTFTATQIVHEYLKYAHKQGNSDARIILTAPTGKAAIHLEKNVRAGIELQDNLVAGTIHAILSAGYNEEMIADAPIIHADLIIVDEASMIDARLFSFFLSAIQSHTKLILMGDKDQLPPVDSGSFFADLVEYSLQNEFIPCAELVECLRSDKTDILNFAYAINHQETDKVTNALSIANQSLQKIDIFNRCTTARQAYKNLYEFCRDKFFQKYEVDQDIACIIKYFEQFKILSCQRKGSAGVDSINEYLSDRFWQDANHGEYLVFPIIITKNEYSLDLFNGDTGVFVQKKRSSRKIQDDDYFYFLNRDLSSVRKLSALMTPNYDYAYCISVHKSQGSEYESILILAPEGASVFGKEALYTAVTRAKSQVFLDASEEVIQEFVMKSSRKISGLRDRLSLTKVDPC
ncbi:MAG: exodeoxyribonuclease V subunit alpha [Chlamydiae bacterium]|nr:exodeoxyribonuclease V subunit alpha [Chlamydiota bacterium]